MKKKESYRHILPHFQQPGQAYFVTWSTNEALPGKAIFNYSQSLQQIKAKMEMYKEFRNHIMFAKMKREYENVRRKYFKTYDSLLAKQEVKDINLCDSELLKIIRFALAYWDNKKLENYAFCVMPNHVHWCFCLKERDITGESIYLQDIMKSVKSYTGRKINELIKREGRFWQKESFDTTIRNDIHLVNAVKYTLMNPVKAGYVKLWSDWQGSYCSDEFLDFMNE